MTPMGEGSKTPQRRRRRRSEIYEQMMAEQNCQFGTEEDYSGKLRMGSRSPIVGLNHHNKY